jgi:hypothetical protein
MLKLTGGFGRVTQRANYPHGRSTGFMSPRFVLIAEQGCIFRRFKSSQQMVPELQ